jgi:hypothetical protein
MGCEGADRQITVEVPGAGLEIAPYEVNFRRQRGKYDYFKATFNGDVGRHIKEYVLPNNKVLSDIQPAYIKMEGERIYPMVWAPKGVKFGKNDTHIELFDPILDLEKAIVDIRQESGIGKDIVEKIFDQYIEGTEPQDRILQEIEFNLGVERDPYTFSNVDDTREALDSGDNEDIGARGVIGGTIDVTGAGLKDIVEFGGELLAGGANVDYDQVSAHEALVDIAEKMEVDVYTQPVEPGSVELKLVVGKFDTYSKKFDATGTRSNVFKATDFTISKPARPIKTVIVRGKPVHDDLLLGAENISEQLFRIGEERHDYVAHAIVKRDISHGKKRVFDADVGLGSLKAIAESKMAELLAREQAGEIVISPAQSSKKVQDYRGLSVGDRIETHPPSVAGGCEDTQMYANTFTMASVEHHISNGAWAIRLDVGDSVGKDDVPEGKVRFFDPRSKEYTKPSDLDEGLLSPTLTED